MYGNIPIWEKVEISQESRTRAKEKEMSKGPPPFYRLKKKGGEKGKGNEEKIRDKKNKKTKKIPEKPDAGSLLEIWKYLSAVWQLANQIGHGALGHTSRGVLFSRGRKEGNLNSLNQHTRTCRTYLFPFRARSPR